MEATNDLSTCTDEPKKDVFPESYISFVSLPCKFVSCHSNAFCIDRPFRPKCVCEYGYAGNGATECDVCGSSFYDKNVRIVGGIEAEPHSWPFHVVVLRKNEKIFRYNNQSKVLFNEFYTCGGTLINKRTVMTAAHCVYDHKPNDFTRENRFYYKSSFKVFVGWHDIQLINEYFYQKELSLLGIDVEKVIKHEMFDTHTYKNDIAILKLKEAVNLGPTVQLICLPNYKNNTVEFPFSNTEAYIMGWGFRNETVRIRGKKLINAKVKILDTTLCNYTNTILKNTTHSNNMTSSSQRVNDEYVRFFSNASEYQNFLSSLNMMYYMDEMYKNNNIENSQVCAGNYEIGAVDSCKGDSGGSLVTLSEIKGQNRYVSSGIVSFGYGCGRPKYPGIYTRTSYFLEWIHEHSGY
ncbi:acrosin isoform X1 [Brachionus plicatilis]|uniref:Acrosin n=1 Tax=Brachionus plicatilis TaxID=10195 RepID=A0A3M7QVQ2_BRAPC|nr:acrosin isoform X1 [Brachionus plicatilis]